MAYRVQVTDSGYSGIFTFEDRPSPGRQRPQGEAELHLKEQYGEFVDRLGLTFHHA